MVATPAPDAVKRLVDRFDQNRDAYLSGSYNETQLRREFIDPFFEALGWDCATPLTRVRSETEEALFSPAIVGDAR